MTKLTAKGGTELIRDRINSTLPKDLLSHFQIIHSRVEDLDPSKKKILVLHDMAQDPMNDHLKNDGWKKFDKLVFVSYWQQQQFHDFLGVPFDAGTVIQNGTFRFEDHEKPDPSEKVKLIYFSTPHRGLDILYAAFVPLSKQYPNIELNVYSSFDLYGWGQRDHQFEDLFTKLREHKKINYHKSVDNDTMRDILKEQHILAYPSTWMETSCLVLIESMMAGLYCVHSSLGALPETSMNLTHMYPFTEDRQKHANLFYLNLEYAIKQHQNVNLYTQLKQSTIAKDIAQSMYDWKNAQRKWDNLLKSLL